MITCEVVGSGGSPGLSGLGFMVRDKRTGLWVPYAPPGKRVFRRTNATYSREIRFTPQRPRPSATRSRRPTRTRVSSRSRIRDRRALRSRRPTRTRVSSRSRIRNRRAAWERAQNIAKKKAADARLTMRKRIEEQRKRSDRGIAARKAQREAQRRAKAARAARIRATTGPIPTKRSRLREWQSYYERRRVKMPATVKSTLERRDKAAFYRKVAGKAYVSRAVGQASGVGVGRGVSWMFQTAYNGDMPYWKLWHDRRASAEQIARMVAADYTREIQRRIALRAEKRQAVTVWEEAGQVGPKPQIDPDKGRISPGAQPVTPLPAKGPPPTPGAPPSLELPALPVQARPAQPGQPPPLVV